MKEYTVVIEETIVQTFKVMAESAEKAAAIGADKYRKGEFEVDQGALEEANVRAIGNGGETDWVDIY